MPKQNFALVAAAAFALAWTLTACDGSGSNPAAPTPAPTVTPAPSPTATPGPTPTPMPAAPVPVIAPPVRPFPAAPISDPPGLTTAPMPAAPAASATLPPVTDAAMMAGALDLPTLIGRVAELTRLKVGELVGDRAFYVVPGGSTRRMLAILDPKLNEGAADAKLKILPGQTLNVRGRIEKLPAAAELGERFGVRGPELDALKGEAIYLHAEQVSITAQP